jgi:hypothetical protein
MEQGALNNATTHVRDLLTLTVAPSLPRLQMFALGGFNYNLAPSGSDWPW